VSLACASAEAADSFGAYPSKPVRIIIPFSPAEAPTISPARCRLAQSGALGQPLVLDNRPGASSIIGTELAARAAPDGYTMVLITTTYTVTPLS
jgi:tripartite-type tricarboxylate transporter receptor subunit TctC